MGQYDLYMEHATPLPASAAARLWLRPVARWLLRAGVTWKEFAAVSRAVFIATASEEFGIKGRPTNVSRIALLTGLMRRDVRKHLDAEKKPSTQSPETLTNASRVLSAWHQDPQYLDADGRPLILAAEGEAPSFSALLKACAGDIPVNALAKELKQSGSIAVRPDGRVQAVKRYYMPRQMDDAATLRAGSVLEDLATTIEFNLTRKPKAPSRFEGRAQNPRIAASDVPAFREFLEREGQQFLERIDNWLSEHEASAQHAPQATVRLGAGLYTIYDPYSGERS